MRGLFILFVSLFLMTGCASPGVGPRGIFFTNAKIAIYSLGEKSSLESKSCIHSILGLFSFGDASISKIKEVGQIKEVTDVNWETKNYLGLYATLCVIVGGRK